MAQRSGAERITQAILFEAIRVLVVTPLYVAWSGAAVREGVALMVAISATVLVWAPAYNTVFDGIEGALTGRPASDRPARVRMAHAVLFEVGSIALTLPLAMTLAGLTVWEAAALNVQLTLFYIGYTYAFFVVYDRLRPVGMMPVAACAAGPGLRDH